MYLWLYISSMKLLGVISLVTHPQHKVQAYYKIQKDENMIKVKPYFQCVGCKVSTIHACTFTYLRNIKSVLVIIAKFINITVICLLIECCTLIYIAHPELFRLLGSMWKFFIRLNSHLLNPWAVHKRRWYSLLNDFAVCYTFWLTHHQWLCANRSLEQPAALTKGCYILLWKKYF